MSATRDGGPLGYIARDPGRALLLCALLAAAVVYAPTLGRGIVNYDDTWLIRDNHILQRPSLHAVRTVWFDLYSQRRFELTPEYLPIRDLSVMLDFALWGHHYGGFHLTNILIYLLAIAIWFFALAAWGIRRWICGVAVLIWALHPSHAESVAWLSERKGLLAMMFGGLCLLCYAKFRTGRSAWYLAAATVAGVLAVWSKAPGAFVVAAIAGLELVVPGRRSWRRSILGLGTVGATTALAFMPVLMLALRWSIVGNGSLQPASRLAMVTGVHGLYLRLGAMWVPNAVSYSLATDGPGWLDIVIGAIGMAAVIAVIALRTPVWSPSPALRAAAMIWLCGWLPVSHVILPLRMVFVADRYLLFPTLGLALAVAVAISQLQSRSARAALCAAIAVAAGFRTLDASESWRSAESLWERAVASNPNDGNAWSAYLDALEEAGHTDRVDRAILEGLQHTTSPRLVMHDALMWLRSGNRAKGIARMTDAAGDGEPRAMANLALLLLADRRVDEALVWARLATLTHPGYVPAHRARGKVALAAKKLDEAHAAFARAYDLEPESAGNRLNLALVLAQLGHTGEARPLLEACVDDSEVGPRARALLRALE